MTTSRSRRLWQAGLRFFAQASVWFVLSLVIAAMMVVGGPFKFLDALRFSGINWMPWALATPIVFWVSRRFPVVRGHLLRSLPIHLVACIVCSTGVSWITNQFPLMLTPANVRTQWIGSGAGGRVMSFRADQPIMTRFGAPPEEPFVSTGSIVAFGPSAGTVGYSISEPNVTHVVLDGVPVNNGAVPPPPEPGGPMFSAVGPMNRVGIAAGRSMPIPAGDWRLRWQMMLVPLAMRANVGFAIYFILAAAAHAIGFYRQAQERQRQALALAASRNQAKLDALRLQLQPHFLFNTLNAIATLVHIDAHAADKLIGDLGDLQRVSLQTTTHEVTLARELELLDHYLAIEQTRLEDRLRIVRDIDPTALGACVPTLILQPLAENAVRHGIEPRLAPGTLTLRARRDGDLLHLTVADDGIGFDPQACTTRRGIGLTNSEERLRTLHGDRAKLTLASPPEGGVRVEITLPFRTAPVTPPPEAVVTSPA